MLSKRDLFLQKAEAFGALCCPKCRSPFRFEVNRCICSAGHSWDINKKGFMNFLSRPVSTCYDADLFSARRQVFEAGIYVPIMQALEEQLLSLSENHIRFLDAGCGEGWYTEQLQARHPDWMGVGMDISKDAILQAANGCSTLWLVGDLRHPPFSPHCFDAVLDILTPADYSTFREILKPEGCLLKVYPGRRYLAEIRQARGMALYEDGKVDDYLASHTQVISREELCYQFPITPELWADLVTMTPLNQDLDREQLEKLRNEPAAAITIDLHIAAARIPE